MADYTIRGMQIAGCSLVLGEIQHCIDDEPEYWGNDPEHLNRLKTIAGLDTRYVASAATTTSDLCEQAAKRLLSALNVPLDAVSVIVSVTQTPDYRMPGNAFVLHGRLGLLPQTAALDVCMGCSGYIHGLWLTGMMLSAAGGGNALLVAGDTLTKLVNSKDYKSAPLFGDAGSATLVRFSPGADPACFSLYAKGDGLSSMYTPAGGFRMPATAETRHEITDKDGNTRSLENMHMDGFGIFTFTMTEQPALLQHIMEYAKVSAQDIDYFVMHQANRYIVETITKKSGIPPQKVPSSVFSRFGNQNSASIPGVLCGELAEIARKSSLQVILQGFGTGLSWGACQIRLDKPLFMPPEIYQPE